MRGRRSGGPGAYRSRSVSTAGPPETLLSGWCQQFRSHSIGDLVFGADGALYVTGGDGAAAHAVDTGQLGHDYWGENPCGDPADEGGALEAQDLVTAGDPAGFNGAVLRIDPETGAALPDNPLVGAGSSDDDRIIAYGLRNPFRFAMDPGTDAIYIADVGWNAFEEVNRIADPTDALDRELRLAVPGGSGCPAGLRATALCGLVTAGGDPVGTLTDPALAIDHTSPPEPRPVHRRRGLPHRHRLLRRSVSRTMDRLALRHRCRVRDACGPFRETAAEYPTQPRSLRSRSGSWAPSRWSTGQMGRSTIRTSTSVGSIVSARIPASSSRDDFEYGFYRWDAGSHTTSDGPDSVAMQATDAAVRLVVGAGNAPR